MINEEFKISDVLIESICDLKNWIYQEKYFKVVKKDFKSDISKSNFLRSNFFESKESKEFKHYEEKTLENMDSINSKVQNCKKCSLSLGRNIAVFGIGNSKSPLMLIGEGPGYEEDKIGEPFVGKAGILLVKMLNAISIKKNQVYICNVVKCRPPNNRNPSDEEINKCFSFLSKQITFVNPQFIVTLGNIATQTILKTKIGISKLRGQTYKINERIIIPMYHPSALLRNEGLKVASWKDLKKLRSLLKEKNLYPLGKD